MKAVIMAGGEGSRLRPLTCDAPKPMARLLGRPIMEYILDLLEDSGVTNAAVTTRYLPNQISDYFLNNMYKSVQLDFVEEETPLGTAGSVKNAAKTFHEDFIVISGDALCDIDLKAAMAFHKDNNADATLVVTRVADPREYGLVSFDARQKIEGFLEKPGWNQAATDAANTGIYILSSNVLDLIPDDVSYDFGKELFPKMLASGKKMLAFETDAYWCDIGDLTTYLSCQSDMLQGKVTVKIAGTNSSGIYHKSALPSGDYELVPPVYIGENVSIGNGAVIGPNCVLDDNVTVSPYAKIRSSIVLPQAIIGERARLTGALVCSGASLKTGACMFEGSAIGSNAALGNLSEVSPNIKIWPGKIIGDNTYVRENVQYGASKIDFFDDDGITGEAGIDLTPEFCARLGAACGSLKYGSRVGVACGVGKAAKVFRQAFSAGVLSTGSQVWDFSEMLESEAAFAATHCQLNLSVYIDTGALCRVEIYGQSGLPAGRAIERDIEALLARGEYKRCTWDNYKEAADMSGLRKLYAQHLYECAPSGLNGISVQGRSSNIYAEQLLCGTLTKLGANIGSGNIYNVSYNGKSLSITDRQIGHISEDKVIAICALIDLKNGQNLCLPFDAPQSLTALAEKYGKTVLRYLSSAASGDDQDARAASCNAMWMRDGIMASLHILAYLHSTSETLSSLVAELPEYSTYKKQFAISTPPSKILTHLGATPSAISEGVTIKSEMGTVFIRPSKKGHRLSILAESYSTEAAMELCAEIEQQLS